MGSFFQLPNSCEAHMWNRWVTCFFLWRSLIIITHTLKERSAEKCVIFQKVTAASLPYHTRSGWLVHWPWLKPEQERRTSPPSASDGRQEFHTPPESQGPWADTRSGGHAAAAAAGGMEVDHSVTAGRAKEIRSPLESEKKQEAERDWTWSKRGLTSASFSEDRLLKNIWSKKWGSDVIRDEMRAKPGAPRNSLQNDSKMWPGAGS